MIKKQIMNHKDPVKDLLHISKGPSKYQQTIVKCLLEHILFVGSLSIQLYAGHPFHKLLHKKAAHGVPFSVPNTLQTCYLYYSDEQLYGESDLNEYSVKALDSEQILNRICC